MFDVFIADTGQTAVLLHNGGLNVCNEARVCKFFNTPRQIVFVDLDGNISFHSRWDGSFLPGVSAATAFPFVGVALTIDPVVRMSLNELTNGPGGNQQPNPGQQPGQQPSQQANQQANQQPTRTANAQQAQAPAQGVQGITSTELLGIGMIGGLAVGIPAFVAPYSP